MHLIMLYYIKSYTILKRRKAMKNLTELTKDKLIKLASDVRFELAKRSENSESNVRISINVVEQFNQGDRSLLQWLNQKCFRIG